jgi:hypothetical protein
MNKKTKKFYRGHIPAWVEGGCQRGDSRPGPRKAALRIRGQRNDAPCRHLHCKASSATTIEFAAAYEQ